MATRQPKAVYDRARQLWKEGKTVIQIQFELPLDEIQIRRCCDPDFAKEQSKAWAKKTVLRRRGVRI